MIFRPDRGWVRSPWVSPGSCYEVGVIIPAQLLAMSVVRLRRCCRRRAVPASDTGEGSGLSPKAGAAKVHVLAASRIAPNWPLWKSSIACLISPAVFMTNGPCATTGSSIGSPVSTSSLKRHRLPRWWMPPPSRRKLSSAPRGRWFGRRSRRCLEHQHRERPGLPERRALPSWPMSADYVEMLIGVNVLRRPLSRRRTAGDDAQLAGVVRQVDRRDIGIEQGLVAGRRRSCPWPAG